MFFAYHNKSKPTGEILAATLGMENGFDPPDSGESLIRWGNRRNPSADSNYDVVLNAEEAIKNASDKFESLFTLSEAGVNVPAASEEWEEIQEEYGYPILGRRFRHARGSDINLILQKRDVRRIASDYYIPYIPTSREYRIHVVRDKVIRIQGKYLDFPDQAVSHIRNYEHGYRFRTPNVRLKPDRLEAAITSVKSLGLDFGAVDLIIADDGNYYILEVNTAPSCSRRTGKEYIMEFSNILGVDSGQITLQTLESLSQEERDTEETGEEDENGSYEVAGEEG